VGGSLRRAALLCSAALCGAAGLGFEVLALSTAGLALGQGAAGAVGLAAYLSAWAVGAWLSGRFAGRPAATLLALGLLGAALAPGGVQLLLAAGSRTPGGALAWASALVSIALPALVHGAFLPRLARAWAALPPRRGRGERPLASLLAANLLGSVAGAFWIGDQGVGLFGRPAAALVAGGTSLLAGIAGACACSGARRARG